MARLAGVDLPNDKRVEIALTYIYGIGRPSATGIVAGESMAPGNASAPDGEIPGHSRGGLTIEIDLLAGLRCRVLARVASAGHRREGLAFNKLRGFRAVATRFDKRELVCRDTIDVAAIRIWLRDPPLDP